MVKRTHTPKAPPLPVAIRIIRGANQTLGRVAPATIARLNRGLFVRPRKFAAREWEHAFECTAQRLRLASGVSVLRAGEGPLVVCIHGWEGRATQFAHFAPVLLAAGFSVVAVDAPAHGHSRGDTSDPFLFADALVEVGRTFGPVHGVVGHSLGAGSIALAMRLGLQTERAVLIAMPASLHEVLHRFASIMHMPPHATRHFMDAMHRRVGARAKTTPDLLELARDTATPALLIHAPDDVEIPFSDSERVAAAMPNARLLAVDGVGHRRILRDETVIRAAVDFLSVQG